jgi:sterol desaturase/sphingolipid hydroxylase (fatty acid hydroxylase superfamily)
MLYTNIHKTHHKFSNPTADTSFYMHPVDLVLSYSVPFIISSLIVPLDSQGQLHYIITYLTYQEIAGHLGKQMYPTSSFAQFIWLPRALDIELYTEDHDLHHKKLNCNFSKRFALWDKIFSTLDRSDLKTLDSQRSPKSETNLFEGSFDLQSSDCKKAIKNE